MEEGEDILQRLPVELVFKILQYCDSTNLACIQLVCRNWNDFASNEELWEDIVKREGTGIAAYPNGVSWKALYRIYRGKSLRVKCVFVGNTYVGKTTLLCRLLTGSIPENVPRILEGWSGIYFVDGKKAEVGFWDTAGERNETLMRHTTYVQANVFVLCFSILDPPSFADVKGWWLPELLKFNSGIPIILVGTKTDLRSLSEEREGEIRPMGGKMVRPIGEEKGRQLAEEIGAAGYYECSAVTKEGVDTLFNAILAIATTNAIQQEGQQLEGKKRCCLC